MATQYILNRVSGLHKKTHPVQLIERATPVHELSRFGKAYGVDQLLIKREDQTDSIYGGNKVRNLEFVLGEAIYRNCSDVHTLIPYGSNFTGALAAQSRKLGIKANLSQFVLQRNPQIEAHVQFGKNQGAGMTTFCSPVGFALASVHAGFRNMSKGTYFISPGASNVLGALGHANALLEMCAQLKQENLALPDRIIVGAGTCGTLAGLIVGTILSGEQIKITGIRCAEPIVCNSRRVASLVNQTLRFLEIQRRIESRDVQILEAPGNLGYAKTNPQIQPMIDEFYSLEQIRLDSTYTAKVLIFLKEALQLKLFGSQRLLYWHTFSPAALEGL